MDYRVLLYYKYVTSDTIGTALSDLPVYFNVGNFWFAINWIPLFIQWLYSHFIKIYIKCHYSYTTTLLFIYKNNNILYRSNDGFIGYLIESNSHFDTILKCLIFKLQSLSIFLYNFKYF